MRISELIAGGPSGLKLIPKGLMQVDIRLSTVRVLVAITRHKLKGFHSVNLISCDVFLKRKLQLKYGTFTIESYLLSFWVKLQRNLTIDADDERTIPASIAH